MNAILSQHLLRSSSSSSKQYHFVVVMLTNTVVTIRSCYVLPSCAVIYVV